jgi:acyl carrier protein
MDIGTFSRQFAEAIEIPIETVQPTSQFKQLEVWDSLCVLTIIAMVDTHYGVSIGGNDHENASTVEDLFNLVRTRTR